MYVYAYLVPAMEAGKQYRQATSIRKEAIRSN